ncbi:MAG: BlaI/MecI/CopY family transcriptional regulator [Verrucomicrobiaceae bacterium]|nr:BlaI/MecI/CopY family transcriptional regulator [Verrucomicrobiaceae bacterium]
MWDEKSEKSMSRRERQVIQIVMKHGRVSARQIEEELPDAPTYSAVRSILRLLVEKEMLVKEQIDGRDWFRLPVNAGKARVKALQSLVQRFFDNSAGEAALALLGQKNVKLSPEEAEKLLKLVKEARKQ